MSTLAAPIPEILTPHLDWAREAVDERLNGLLLNWYDGKLGHYIGKHRDSTVGMVEDAPIVTISLGETRRFRLREYQEAAVVDIAAKHGAAIVMPYAANLTWTHEITKSARAIGRRVSITLRAFS